MQAQANLVRGGVIRQNPPLPGLTGNTCNRERAMSRKANGVLWLQRGSTRSASGLNKESQSAATSLFGRNTGTIPRNGVRVFPTGQTGKH